MLIVDTMEVTNNPLIAPTLKKLGINYEVEPLEIGDYTNTERTFVVERKKEDFWDINHTILQLGNMSTLSCDTFLFIEGTPSEWEGWPWKKNAHPQSMVNWGKAVIASCRRVYGVSPCFCESLQKLLEMTYWLDRESDKPQKPIVHKLVKFANDYETTMANAVGLGMGQKLLAEFQTPARIILASDDELLAVKGIGPATIEKLRAKFG